MHHGNNCIGPFILLVPILGVTHVEASLRAFRVAEQAVVPTARVER